MQQNQVGARMIFDKLPSKYAGMRATQSYLRLEQALAINKTIFQFPVLVNEAGSSGIFNTEQRLNLQDSFVISSLAVFLGAPASATDAAYKLNTYPNGAEAFTTALSAAAALVVYNSKLSISVNNNKILPSWDVFRHYKVPVTQLTAAVNSAATQTDGAEDSWYPVEPNISLVGNLNSVITIELPAGITTVHPFSRVIVFLRGILVQQS